MNFAVNGLVGVNLAELGISKSSAALLGELKKLGFSVIDQNLTTLALSCVGKDYKRPATKKDAPESFSCSSLTKWVYGQVGIWIPSLAIQQFNYGIIINPDSLQQGDLLFTASFYPLYEKNPSEGVGHVGMALGDGTCVFATNRKTMTGVVQAPVNLFTEADDFRGARRMVNDLKSITTIKVPTDYEIESSDDIKWLLIRHLS
jgi:hypothetical protein